HPSHHVVVDHQTVTRTMNRLLAIAALIGAAGLAACDKNAVQLLPLAPVPSARIMFFNYGVGDPQVNFYANETKMTAISSATGTESTNGVAYGAVGNGGLYSALEPGPYTLTGRIAATTDKNLPIDTLVATLADGKFYSFYLTGFYNTTTKKADAFILEDPIPSPVDYTVASLPPIHPAPYETTVHAHPISTPHHSLNIHSAVWHTSYHLHLQA